MAKSRVVFSLPRNDFFETIDSTKTGEDQFIWQSFKSDASSARIIGKRVLFSLEKLQSIELKDNELWPIISKDQYQDLVEKAIRFSTVVDGKVVLSRYSETRAQQLDIAHSLLKLKAAFDNALIYLLITEKGEVWLGATPETLVKQNESGFNTMSLAGTKWHDDPFEEKEFIEQSLVTDSIKEKLSGESPKVGDRTESAFGPIRHLQTNIEWSGNRSIEDYACLLHPTPAICGFPEKEAKQFILDTENYDRELYTGYLGLVDSNENSHLFVNLRCMQLFRNHIRMYAGGGINAMSNPQTEWEETNRKMNTVLKALNING